VYDERPNAGLFYRVTVLRYKKHDSLPYKMHLVCGVSEVTSPFSLLWLLGVQEMAAVDP
jgi:hypothetical protein